MMENIKQVGNDWNYLHDNYQYTRITFFNEYMHVSDVSLKDIIFRPIFNSDVTIEKIKSFYKDCINENWSMDLNNFQKNYEGLVELTLYDNCLILLKFEREKYYKLFNIEKGYSDFGTEMLFIPYSLKLVLEYTTFSNKLEKASIEFIFGNYVEDALVVRKVISDLLTIETKPFLFPDYIIILLNKENKIKK